MKYKNVLQIKVNLQYSKPNIYRVFYFPANSTFLELHAALQDIMGWTSTHLYQFRKNRTYIGIPQPKGSFWGEETLDVAKEKISSYFEKEKDSIVYDYDFGDSWMHNVVVEKVFDEIELPQLPYCKKAVRACPFEDCGGIGGYEEICDAFKNPKHPSYEDYNEWYDFENFDPEYVDLEEINDLLSVFDEACENAKDDYDEIKKSL